MIAGRFARGAVASPHHLATAAGRDVLAAGGNAVDAAVAANLMLGVVAPYHCGYGGDLFAMVWDGALHGLASAGRAPAAATPEAVRAAAGSERMPPDGALTVTVPGVVAGWFALLDRWGTMPFADLAAPAERAARDGFALGAKGAATLERDLGRFGHEPLWRAVYGEALARGRLVQTDLARTIAALSERGPAVYYEGEIAAALVDALRARGALMTAEDLSAHRAAWVEPLRARFGPVEVAELPPPTQGVTALQLLRIADGVPAPDLAARVERGIGAARIALADRDAHVTDPDAMRIDPADLLTDDAIERARARLGTGPAPVEPSGGTDTGSIVAADANGMAVSLIQSNWLSFGSGVMVPGWGINLHSRGAHFSLDPAHINVIGPRKRTMHTLIPAMALRDGVPWLVFGTMGGHGQPQTHLQLLERILTDGMRPGEAIDAPRWYVDPGDGRVQIEDRFEPTVIEHLRARGYECTANGPYDGVMGHANAIALGDGFDVGSDPRSEGAALGI